ncbi:hypothetical protein [Altericista sp. CCNU0014]|uniref:hypothetical protein n=1 Tax=Altericista sp. CCNU0014 TaxID=3082949 RepID=UPI00384B3EBC
MPEDHSSQEDFRAIEVHLHQLVERSQADPVALLKILRFLEQLHNEVRELHFQPSLPIYRHELYAMLREVEAEGGWPYIPRMQLREILSGHARDFTAEEEGEGFESQ